MSRLPFELFLALRYLKPKRTFVSVITLISIIGVMLGVAVLIVVISVMSGFDRELRDRILGFNAHIQILPAASVMTNYRHWAHVVAENPEVKGVAPFVMGQVLIETEPKVGNPIALAPVIRGIDPKLESSVSVLPSSIVAGHFDVRDDGVLVGRGMAAKLHLHVGDLLAIYSINMLRSMRESRREGEETYVLPDDYEVRGIFDVGYYDYNELFLICSLKTAQRLYGLADLDAVHGLMVMLKDPDQVDRVRAELAPKLPPDMVIKTWKTENSQILDALVVEKNVMFYLLFFIMIVAAFGIASALITFVVQKTREIGMLKALGATRVQVMWLFLSQSLLVGVMGVLLGFGLGMLAVSYRNEFLHFMRQATGWELFPASIYHFSQLPALLVPRDIAIICGGSLLICLLAGLLPAWNAGRLKPVEALRYE